MTKNHYLIAISLALLVCSRASAQSEFHNINRFTAEHGFSAAPTCLVEDKHGFMWVGTVAGLFRLDGDRATEIDMFTPTGQSNRHIIQLTYDERADELWIATQGGLLKYNLPNRQAQKIDPLEFFPKEQLVKEKSEAVFVDRQGDRWVDLQVNGIVRLPAGGGPPQQYSIKEMPGPGAEAENLTRTHTVICIIQDLFQDSILWAGTRRGLLRINKTTGQARLILFRTLDPHTETPSNAMLRILPHPNGKLYIGAWNGGLLEFDPIAEQFRQFFLSEKGFDPDQLINQVRSIFARNGQELWVSSGDEQLYVFNWQTREMNHLRSWCGVDYIDRAGNLWNATTGGLQFYHRQSNQVERHYFANQPGIKIEKIQAVRDFDRNGKLLIKVKGQGGIVELDRRTGAWTLIPFPGGADRPVNGEILEKTGAGILSNNMERLYILTPGSSRFRELPFRLPAGNDRYHATSTPDGSVFISGINGYFCWLKPGFSEMITYSAADVQEPFPGYFSEVKVCPPDRFGRPWIVTAAGYSIFIPGEDRFLHFPYREQPDKILAANRDLWPDDRGRMWCNNPNTLGWIDQEHPELGLQQRFDAAGGYDFQDVYFPRTDRWGRVWFVVRQGLVCLDPETGRWSPYGTWAFTLDRLSGGELAVGAAEGIGIIQPDSLMPERSVPKPYLTAFRAFETEKNLGANPFSPEPIRLKPDENTFSVRFSAHNFFFPGKFKLAYQLAGVDRDWVYPERDVRSAAYSNLTGGHYTFRLKAADALGNWGEPYELPIFVGTPWYRTTAAYLLYTLLAMLMLWSAFQFQKRRYELRAKLAAEQVEARRLKELDRFKSRFFTNITHEFRTPLTLILGMAETLREGNNGRSDETAGMIERNGRHLLDLVNQMLDLAKLEAGSLQLHPVQADVMLFLKVTVEAFGSLASSKKQELTFYADPENLLMDFDPRQLRQVVGNLVANALKFTPENGSITVRAESDGHTLQLAVKDTGPGIPEAQLPLLFDRFFQLDTGQQPAHGGTGIGLALTRELTQIMGGSIEASSRPGEGSIFRVELPVTRTAPAGSWENPSPLPSSNGTARMRASSLLQDFYESSPVLLIIEDNDDLVQYLAALLRESYHLLFARNGREGLEKALELMPDLVLSDVMMPEMDGFEVCRRLKNDLRTSHIPVVLLTARAAVEDRVEGINLGADAYLPKPFDRRELFAQLDNLLQRRQRLKAYFTQKAQLEERLTAIAHREDQFLQRLRSVIDEHLEDEHFEISRLAKIIGMSRMQLHRKLTALTGQSASVFVRAHRLQRAKELLESTSLTVSEVAYQVGFSDPSYFSKCFRKAYGVTPKESRKLD